MTEAKTLIGQLLGRGRYHVKRQLGEGGMAVVLLAYDSNVGVDVALKMPKPEMLADPEFAARFTREIRAIVELTHPHIIKIKDVGEFNGVPFYVMDLLSGGTLEDRFGTNSGVRKPQPPASLADWLSPVARALDYLHKRFLHRDIKPANIMFDAAGNPFLSDFGIVKTRADGGDRKKLTNMTQAGVVLGTCAYIAPEVTAGKPYDGRADQYALAATVYEVLTSRVPFDGDTLHAVIMQQVTGKPPPLTELPPPLRSPLTRVIEKALSFKPTDRYENCEAFARSVLASLQPPRLATRTAASPAERKADPPPAGGRDTAPMPRPKAETKSIPARLPSPKPSSVEGGTRDGDEDSTGANRSLVWVVIAAAVLLLGAGGLAAAVLLFGKKGDREKYK